MYADKLKLHNTGFYRKKSILNFDFNSITAELKNRVIPT
jgi:hypothetical protein